MEIKEKIIEIVADKLGFDVEEIEKDLNQKITDDLGADSLDMVEIIMEIENKLDLHIEDEDIQGIQTVDEMIKKVEEIEGRK